MTSTHTPHLDLVWRHLETVVGDDVAQEFHGNLVEFTLVTTIVETISEPSENFLHVFPMVVQVV